MIFQGFLIQQDLHMDNLHVVARPASSLYAKSEKDGEALCEECPSISMQLSRKTDLKTSLGLAKIMDSRNPRFRTQARLNARKKQPRDEGMLGLDELEKPERNAGTSLLSSEIMDSGNPRFRTQARLDARKKQPRDEGMLGLDELEKPERNAGTSLLSLDEGSIPFCRPSLLSQDSCILDPAEEMKFLGGYERRRFPIPTSGTFGNPHVMVDQWGVKSLHFLSKKSLLIILGNSCPWPLVADSNNYRLP